MLSVFVLSSYLQCYSMKLVFFHHSDIGGVTLCVLITFKNASFFIIVILIAHFSDATSVLWLSYFSIIRKTTEAKSCISSKNHTYKETQFSVTLVSEISLNSTERAGDFYLPLLLSLSFSNN